MFRQGCASPPVVVATWTNVLTHQPRLRGISPSLHDWSSFEKKSPASAHVKSQQCTSTCRCGSSHGAGSFALVQMCCQCQSLRWSRIAAGASETVPAVYLEAGSRCPELSRAAGLDEPLPDAPQAVRHLWDTPISKMQAVQFILTLAGDFNEPPLIRRCRREHSSVS